MKKIVNILLAGVLAVSTLLAGCGAAGASDTGSAGQAALTKIRLGVGTSRTPHLTAIVAQQEGIFEKNGLDVEIVEFSSGIETVNGIALGQVDFGYVADFGGLNRIGNASNTDLKFLARLESSSTMILYVKPDIKDVSQLKGKKFATNVGTAVEYWAAKVLENHGLSRNDVEFVTYSSGQESLAMLAKGSVDAIWIGTTNAAKAEEYGYVALTSQEKEKLDQDSYYVATSGYEQKNQDTLVKFFQAIEQTNKFIEENQDKAAQDVNKATGMETDVFKRTIAGINLKMDFPKSAYDNLNSISAWAKSNGYYKNDIVLDNYIDTSVLKKALPDAEVYK